MSSQLTLVDDHEVGVTVLVDLTDSAEQEANASVLKKIKTIICKNKFPFRRTTNEQSTTTHLVTDDGHKLSLDSRVQCHGRN